MSIYLRTKILIPTMKSHGAVKNEANNAAQSGAAAPAEAKVVEKVDFDTFAKPDFRAVKILACEAVTKSKKLLKFTLDDGEREDRVILSGIHEYHELEELIGKTAIAIVNLPPRKMMSIASEGMLISSST